jgi:nicotinamidase-related amidase
VNNTAFITDNAACTQCASDPSSCFTDAQAMWTDHCLQTGDSTFPPSLTKKSSDVIIQKGRNQYVDAYSAFMDNSQNLKTELDAKLQERGVDTLFVAGIATDVCVRWTVRDALGDKTGNFTVKVISDASAGLALGTTPTQLHEDALSAMAASGATLVTSEQVLAMSCPATTKAASTTGDAALSVSGAARIPLLSFLWLVLAYLAFVRL